MEKERKCAHEMDSCSFFSFQFQLSTSDFKEPMSQTEMLQRGVFKSNYHEEKDVKIKMMRAYL